MTDKRIYEHATQSSSKPNAPHILQTGVQNYAALKRKYRNKVSDWNHCKTKKIKFYLSNNFDAVSFAFIFCFLKNLHCQKFGDFEKFTLFLYYRSIYTPHIRGDIHITLATVGGTLWLSQ